MIRSRILLKSFAIFFIVEMLISSVAPAVSWALTAGPSAPEFSSFEPIDTTDIVNLATGDLVYNMPVIEIPGPEGGYPLSLSYHAGIKVEQEASWVGLGFTLNPGAINRSVNGYADDNYQTQNVVKDYWGGGESRTKAYNYSVGIMGINFNYTQARTDDTYKGFSTNSSYGVSVDPVALFLSAASMANSEPELSNKPSESNAGSTISSHAYSSTGGISLGASIDSKGKGSTSVNVFGLNLSKHNNSAGKISSYTTSTGVGSAGFSYQLVNVGFNRTNYYTRYWSDETQSLNTFGSLFPGSANVYISSDHFPLSDYSYDKDMVSYAFDMNNLYDNSVLTDNRAAQSSVDDINDPQKQIGGSFPAYDQYSVLGQGIEGVMQPIIFENGDLYGQSLYDKTTDGNPSIDKPMLSYKSLKKFTNKKVDFRFINEFSNALQVTPSAIRSENDDLVVDAHTIEAKPEGFNNEGINQKLAGSKHIEWFTNQEITNGEAQAKGFVDFYENKADRKLEFEIYRDYMQPEVAMPYKDQSFQGKKGVEDGQFITSTYPSNVPEGKPDRYKSLKSRTVDIRKRIGAFKVTNATGVTYHYALPVYNYNEYARTTVRNPRKGTATFKEDFNEDPYAYTWLLTAITGPDYIDSNTNGILDDTDWGYWVKFDYGRWADSYQWRTPHSEHLTDLEGDNLTFSYGIKELYYLDAIETRSHKAIFIKSKRKDGRGVTSRLEGGSKPRHYNMHLGSKDASGTGARGRVDFYVSPVSTMKLDAIYLFNKSDLTSIPLDKTHGEKYMEAPSSNPLKYAYTGELINTRDFLTLEEGKDFVYIKYHNGNLVYDDDDIHDLPEFRQKALKIIEFKTDYKLVSGTENSIGYFSDRNSHAQVCIAEGDRKCSHGLDTRIGLDFEWPLDFGDCFNGFPKKTSPDYPRCCLNKNTFYSSHLFDGYVNDVQHSPYKCADADKICAGATIAYQFTGRLTLNQINFLGRGGANLLPPTTFDYHINPGYSKRRYDEWGYYKTDYTNKSNDVNATRRITDQSAQYVKAWSLKSVTTPLGAKFEIEYEANRYNKSVYNDFSTFSIEDMKVVNGNTVELFFNEKLLDLHKWFTVGKNIDMKSIILYNLIVESNSDIEVSGWFNWNPSNWTSIENVTDDIFGDAAKRLAASADSFFKTTYETFESVSDPVIAINENSIVIQSETLVELLTRKTFVVGETLHPTRRDSGGRVDKPYSCVAYILSGFVKADDPKMKYSGGVRVKSISMLDANLRTNKTIYEYTDPSDKSVSSGVTSFKPFDQLICRYKAGIPYFDAIFTMDIGKSQMDKFLEFQSDFQKLMDEPYSKILAFNREVSGPGPIYEYVTVRNYVDDVPFENYTVHHFKTFNENMVERTSKAKHSGDRHKDNISRTVNINNSVSDVGGLLDVKTYGATNNLIKSVTYNYLYDENLEPFEQGALDSKQGIVEQSFNKRIILSEYENTHDGFDVIFFREKALISKRQDRTNAITGVTEIDYKLGITTATKSYEFDFYTGQVLKSVSEDSYGNKYMSVSEPAYKEHYKSMGLKIFNPLNAHMLTQVTGSNMYKINDAYEPTGLLTADIQTWSQTTPVLNLSTPQNIWRQGASYQWGGEHDLNLNEGTYSYDDFKEHPFTNWNNIDQQNDNWQKIVEPTLYDVYSHNLESKDINDNYAAVRMDPFQQKVLASASNARYNEIVFDGMEAYEGNSQEYGSASHGDGNSSTAHVHTGQFSLLVGSGKSGYNYTLKPEKADLTKKYKASVWVYLPGEAETQAQLDNLQFYYKIDNQEKGVAHPIVQKSKSKSWYILNLDINPTVAGSIFIGVRNNTERGAYFDDFRVQPLTSSLTTYVYDPATDELNFILDENNFYTKFEYDAIGRLVRISKELLNFDFGEGQETFRADAILKEVKYNYGK